MLQILANSGEKLAKPKLLSGRGRGWFAWQTIKIFITKYYENQL